MQETKCVICGSDTKVIYDPQIIVDYDVCEHCGFIYKQKKHHLPHVEEEKRYLRHENTFENKAYVNMFQDMIEEFIEYLYIKRKVLDFGSGPVPVLKKLLQDKKYDVYDYDFFYNRNEEYKDNKYQLIVSTEVVEHFSDPIKEFKHLVDLLEDGGYLLITTYFRKMNKDQFLVWWYRRDITHVSFYNMKTFEYLAKEFNLEIVKHNNKNTILFKKK